MPSPRRLLIVPPVVAAVLGMAAATASASCAGALDTSHAFGTGSATRSAPVAPVAHSAQAALVATTATTILAELAKGAVSAVGGAGAGSVLTQIGLNPTAIALAGLSEQLTAVNGKLNELAGSVQEIKAASAQSHYSDLVTQALPIVTDIKYVDGEIRSLKDLTGANRKRHTRYILEYICGNLLDKQVQLNERLVGTGTGADTIIVASSRAAKNAQLLWTQHQSNAMRNILDYYSLYEALLLQFRTEWWNAIGMDRSYVRTQIANVKAQVDHQYTLLKPDVDPNGHGRFVDTRNPGLLWWPISMKDSLPAYSATEQAEIRTILNRDYGGDWNKMGLQLFRGSGHSIIDNICASSLTGRGAFGGSCLWFYPINLSPGGYYIGDLSQRSGATSGFRPPTVAEVQSLIHGWTGSPISWLPKQANPPLKMALSAWYGLHEYRQGKGLHAPVTWTNQYKVAVNLENGSVRHNEWDQAPWGVYAVAQTDARGYWY